MTDVGASPSQYLDKTNRADKKVLTDEKSKREKERLRKLYEEKKKKKKFFEPSTRNQFHHHFTNNFFAIMLFLLDPIPFFFASEDYLYLFAVKLPYFTIN